jgi:hypothetical protein
MSASLGWFHSPEVGEAWVVRRRRGVVDPVRLGVEHLGVPFERGCHRRDGLALRDTDDLRSGNVKLALDLRSLVAERGGTGGRARSRLEPHDQLSGNEVPVFSRRAERRARGSCRRDSSCEQHNEPAESSERSKPQLI